MAVPSDEGAAIFGKGASNMEIESKSTKMKIKVLVENGVDKQGRRKYQNAFRTPFAINPQVSEEKILRIGEKMGRLLKSKIKKIKMIETVELTAKEDNKETPEQ